MDGGGGAAGAGVAICIGTSATMASAGSSSTEVAKVSRFLFGVDFAPEQVIGETLERATPEIDTTDPSAPSNRIRRRSNPERNPSGARTPAKSSASCFSP